MHPSLDCLTPGLIFVADEVGGIDPDQSGPTALPVAPQLGQEDSSATDIPGKPLKKTKPAAAAVFASNKRLSEK